MFARRVFIALLAASLGTAKACTAYAAGKGATKDGSVIVSHSDDGAGSSVRISHHRTARALRRVRTSPALSGEPVAVGP